MIEYTLYFTQVASSTVTVTAESLDEAIERAYDELPSGLCASCSGWGPSPGVDLSGDWELDEESAAADYPAAS